MRFDRLPRYEPLTWTPRKQALALSRPARELAKARQALPLLADQLEEGPAVCLDEVADSRQRFLDQAERRMRDLLAQHWRKARAAYFASSSVQRDAIRRAWSAWRGPLRPLYLLYLVEQETGAAEARNKALRARDEARLAAAIEQLSRQGALPFEVCR